MSLGFSVNKTTSSASSSSFTSSFPVGFLFFPCLIALARASSTMATRNGHACLVPGKPFFCIYVIFGAHIRLYQLTVSWVTNGRPLCTHSGAVMWTVLSAHEPHIFLPVWMHAHPCVCTRVCTHVCALQSQPARNRPRL